MQKIKIDPVLADTDTCSERCNGPRGASLDVEGPFIDDKVLAIHGGRSKRDSQCLIRGTFSDRCANQCCKE